MRGDEVEAIINEKSKYSKTYSTLMFSVDDLRRMLDSEELNKRSFIQKVDVLKDYIEFLDNLEKESKKDKGFIKKLFNSSKPPEDQIKNYLTKDKLLNINKLEKCKQCECRNCVSICPMNSCYNCREKEYVSSCNKQNTMMTKSEDKVTLYQGDEEFIFNVAAYLVEKDTGGNHNRYVYLIDTKDYDNQHLLKYSKFKGEEYYESVIIDNTQDELVRLNDKFIEMGLRI